MSEPIDLSAFIAIRDQYAHDVEKAQRDVERATAKLEQAKTRLGVADDMIAKARNGDGKRPPRSVADMIADIFKKRPDELLTVRQIGDVLREAGMFTDPAAIHVNADRLVEREVLKLVSASGAKAYRLKPLSPNTPEAESM